MKLNGGDMDMREELEIMLADYGHDVILVKADHISCTCTAGQSQQANSMCPICMGIGRRITVEKIRVIDKMATPTSMVPFATGSAPIGNIYGSSKTFYTRYYEAPTVGSYIIEVSWRKNKPLNIINVYKLEFSEPYRMDRGRQEYWYISGNRDAANINLKEQILRKLYR